MEKETRFFVQVLKSFLDELPREIYMVELFWKDSEKNKTNNTKFLPKNTKEIQRRAQIKCVSFINIKYVYFLNLQSFATNMLCIQNCTVYKYT